MTADGEVVARSTTTTGDFKYQRAYPLAASVVTPTVALTVVLMMAATSANLNTSGARSMALRPPAKRLTRYAPTMPSRVLPMPRPIEVRTVPAVVTLTRNAPMRIAGHTRMPKIRNAAMAMPVGGQTAVALACTNASRRPSLPATT